MAITSELTAKLKTNNANQQQTPAKVSGELWSKREHQPLDELLTKPVVHTVGCPECGYTDNIHAAWCKQPVLTNDLCPTCHCGPLVPGYLRQYGDDVTARLVPCPDCHAAKMAKRVKQRGQLEGELKRKNFANFGVTDDNREAWNAARTFAANPVGWLTLYGEHGPGKTHLCAAVANALGDQAMYFNMPDLTNLLKEDFEQTHKIQAQLKTVKVLILDELDKVHLGGWTREQLQIIFDHRYRNADKYGLMIGDNTTPEDYGMDLQFIGSRMRDERFTCLKMIGDNRPIKSQLARLARLQQVD